ncbi:MAG: hypothetical protein AOA66_0826 [Candidatus Bathyarchaeota archaeon BA2]|nr:MAG: hypothetical protein AOA66_0826 [Candidatus Bathyarchaeota archaeon BA2]
MKTQVILRRNAITFCAFEGKCRFKKLATKENAHQPKTRYAICTWKDRCNQQTNHSGTALSK